MSATVEPNGLTNSFRPEEPSFRSIADFAPVLIWTSDAQNRCTYCNRAWLEFTGRTLEQELGVGWTQNIHPEEVEACLKTYQTSFLERKPFSVRYRLRRNDSVYRWVLDSANPYTDENGNFAGFVGSCVDITEQQLIEEALNHKARMQAGLAVFGRLALSNHHFPVLLSQAARIASEVITSTIAAVLELQSGDQGLMLVAGTGAISTLIGQQCGPASAEALTAPAIIRNSESFLSTNLMQQTGARSAVSVPIGATERAFGLLVIFSLADYEFSPEAIDFLEGLANTISTLHQRNLAESALRDSETRLLQSQKMEAVGILAGGVAHDFNNLLTAIRCYAEMLNEDLAPIDADAHQKANEILKATTRASALTRQLLSFSRKQVIQPESINLNSVILDMKELIRSLLGANIQLEVEPASGMNQVRADRNQVEQVIINLAVNGRDAMPRGGKLSLATRARTLTITELVGHPDVRPGRYVELSVADSGGGMTEETKARVFQPFFTTKLKGRGTGLGLATCLSIARQFNGLILFQSQLGVGTAFQFLLPEVDEHPTAETDPDLLPTPNGDENILLVEDDDFVREVTTSILRSLGYHLTVTANAFEALQYFGTPTAPNFQMVLTDVIMPGMSGRELAERVKLLHPSLPFLFMSGYIEDANMRQAFLDESIPFLGKPFTGQSLARKVRETLDARKQSK